MWGYWSTTGKCQLIRFGAYLYPRGDDRWKDCSCIYEIRRSVPPFSICLLQVDIEVYNELPVFSREDHSETWYFLLRHWCSSLVTNALRYHQIITSTLNPHLTCTSSFTPICAISPLYVTYVCIDSIILLSGRMGLICTKLLRIAK